MFFGITAGQKAQAAVGPVTRIAENGDTRIAENGDTRVQEDGEGPEDPPTAAEVLATDYSNRVTAAGGTVTSDGLLVITEVFQSAIDNDVSITSGWLFGSAVNVSKTNIINLIEAKGNLVPIGTVKAESTLSPGMLGLRIDGTNQGLVDSNASPFFTNDINYGVLYLGGYAGDVVNHAQSAPYIFDQDYSPSLAGNVSFLGGSTGGSQWVDRTNYTTSVPGGNFEQNVNPLFAWWHFDADGNQQLIHPGSEAKTTPQPLAGNPAGALRLATHNGSGDIGYCVLLRFDGILTDAKRKDIYDRIWAAYRKITKACLIIGNSVTITGVSHAYRSWPKQVQRWGIYNNMLVGRRAKGARRLPFFAPVGYVLPEGSPADADIAVEPVDDHDWFAPNILVNDDQQNMIANGQPWASFLHCHNAIVGHFLQFNPAMLGVICTQMAHGAYQFDGTLDNPVSFETVAAGREKFLLASQAARIEAGYNGVATQLAEIYTAFNLGWDTEFDGNPPDPVNDLPNGNMTLLADAQHPNQAGHDVMFAIYRDALIALVS